MNLQRLLIYSLDKFFPHFTPKTSTELACDYFQAKHHSTSDVVSTILHEEDCKVRALWPVHCKWIVSLSLRYLGITVPRDLPVRRITVGDGCCSRDYSRSVLR